MMTIAPPMKKSRAVTRDASFSGESLTYAFAKSSLGLVLATTSNRGLCSVVLGHERDLLLTDLRNRFPKSSLSEDAADTAGVAAAVARLIESPDAGFTLPLDLRGTPFQQAVWEALRQIPAGETTTYSEIARRIGTPKAVRAVGAACGANRLAVVVPCHRVIASSGNLTGYRWGLHWKRALLDREKQATI